MKKLIAAVSCGLLIAGCCNEDFIIPESSGPANDMRANAIDITSLFDAPNCPGANPIYTTEGSTPDGGIGSCWEDQRNAGDVWFKFTGQGPNGYFSVYIETAGPAGTQQASQFILLDTDGASELSCDGYNMNTEDIYDFSIVEVGVEYYFSVSVPAESNKGTFSMCVTTSD
ncbi:MAG: hypothetical protein RLQ12_18715 [Cyclobacteriaceae bacterium]